MSNILVLDDDTHIQRTLDIMLRNDGHSVICAGSAEEALERANRHPVDIALVDLQLPGMSGLDFLRKLREQHPDAVAIIITAYGSIETAVESMKEGAHDYLTKPFSPEQVRHRLRQIEEMRGLKAEVRGLRRRLGDEEHNEFPTRNPAVFHVLELARTVADVDATVLITGESGTGKNLLARLIHSWSPRQNAPFAVVDCTCFQETLLESELFGHKRGTFTGAVFDKPGKVEAAQGGTLFLDEVGETPAPLQGKLLRLVEDRVYERLGDPTPRTMDARIIAATNRNLYEMVAERLFRQDLFYRLSVVELSIPALRHRPEDVPLLAERFINEFNRVHGRAVGAMDPEVAALLVQYSWPGNVRELANLIERAILLCSGDTLHKEHLPPRVLAGQPAPGQPDEVIPLAELEESHIRRALALGLPFEEAASRLGIDPSTLWRKRKKYNI
ncbi:MAG TPA: sigma-54 dependent transcriptional regulator [Candidatus Hydrogenedentes bacterium]|nr:sigma-54 dependent transcriptional regulator [Candidatus Hydrogenedentota bacterium]HQE84428.1 sigma-54 dependent transcriptional regulator [Candidatus Hydrogenedentota bacterium]HQH52274.1 sigma-54 dependent transcriptional regulator [Candidatus Hydrogenedentota bacterium]HQM48851.1 sigma-54 dependent transcriptional regulator [Candidatus Hydrogenedentota bacterium]